MPVQHVEKTKFIEVCSLKFSFLFVLTIDVLVWCFVFWKYLGRGSVSKRLVLIKRQEM
jgi:hypothetical protein